MGREKGLTDYEAADEIMKTLVEHGMGFSYKMMSRAQVEAYKRNRDQLRRLVAEIGIDPDSPNGEA
jgi:hypothetical protein